MQFSAKIEKNFEMEWFSFNFRTKSKAVESLTSKTHGYLPSHLSPHTLHSNYI